MSNPRSIVVFRNGSIGNTLAAVPAIHALRESFPDARITVVLDSLGRELLLHCPYFNDVQVYDKHGADQGLVGFVRIARGLRRTKPDWAILLKRFFRNGLLARLSGATRRIGYRTDGRASFLTESISYDESIAVAELNIRLVASAGAKAYVSPIPEVFFSDEEREAFAAWRSENNLGGPYVVIHFGGITSGAGFLNMEKRAALVRELAGQANGVLIGRGERETADAHELKKIAPALQVVTNVPLRLSMLLIAHASGFIGTNSGPMHLAAASRIPGIALFHRDSRFEIESVKWRPLYEGLKVIPVSAGDETATVVKLAAESWPAISK